MSKTVSRDMLRLLFANMSYRASTIIMKIFLNIFLFKVTGDIKIVALYSLTTLGFHMIGYTAFSYILKKGFRNLSQGASLFGTATLLLIQATYTDFIVQNYILFGMIYGICSGIYRVVFNQNQFDFTVPKNRGNYEGLKKSLRTTVSLAVPVIIGAIIVYTPFGYGYQVSFLIAALLCLVSAFYGRVNEGKLTLSEKKFHMWGFIQESFKHPNIWMFLGINVLISFALSMPLIEFLLPIILYNDGVDEAGIGFFVSLAGGISIIASLIYGKYVDYHHYKKSFFLSGVIYVFCIAMILYGGTSFFVYAFMPLAILLYISMDIPRSVFVMNILHDLEDYKRYQGEYILFTEIAIIVGRMAVFVLLLLAGNLEIHTILFIFGSMGGAMLVAMILFQNLKLTHK